MGKFLLTPAQKRELNVRIRDLEMMFSSLPQEEYFATLGKLVSMRLALLIISRWNITLHL